jgi:chemotaxis protein MotA
VADSKANSVPAGKSAGKKSSAGGGKPDLATLGGISLALAGILGGLILEKGSIKDVSQVTAAMIVFGGTFGAVLITTPLPVFLEALKALRGILFVHASSSGQTIDTLMRFATQARKNGIVSLEKEAGEVPDPFLRKALNLAVDGTDMTEIRKMMEIDMELAEQSEEQQAKVWEAAGGYAPTIGIIGAVLGLIQVMKNLDDIKEVGHGIAVAFVATVYGVGSANILFLPSANKLRARIHHARILKEMVLEGVVGIVEGLNPTLIRMKLMAYDHEPARKAPKSANSSTAPAPGKAAAAQTAPAGD